MSHVWGYRVGARTPASALLDMIARPAWHGDAACKEHPELAWFPHRGEALASVQAVAVCRECLVRSECLAVAMADPTLQGIWGGSTEAQRKLARSAEVA